MGNHHIGRAIVAIATAMAERRKEGETALEILDAAVAKAEGQGADAEFDDECRPTTEFGAILIEAFAPAGRIPDDYDEEGNGGDADLWWDEVQHPFSARYNLC